MLNNTYKISEQKYVRWKLFHEPGDLIPYIYRTARFLVKRGGESARHSVGDAKIKLVHYGLHGTGDNAGDLALFSVTPDIINHFIKSTGWSLRNLRETVTDEAVIELNRSAHGVVVGGGGMFIPDVNAGSVSGWQWPCSKEQLNRLEVPLSIFAIGYNRFRDQVDFPPVFTENIEQLVGKCAFFGLRNPGSIRAIRSYLPERLHSRVEFQPCPTTMLRYYWPTLKPNSPRNQERVVAMNFVSDRALMRFKGRVDDVINGFARIAKLLNEKGWKIILTTHARIDAIIIPTLKAHGVRFSVEHLERRFLSEIVEFYKNIPLTIGMRGHAQMIPFGCGNAIVSLVSHDKVAFFLESIGKPHWGVEVLEPNFVERTLALVDNFDKNRAAIHQEIDEAQAKLWQHTTANMAIINSAVLKRAQSMGVQLNGAVAA